MTRVAHDEAHRRLIALLRCYRGRAGLRQVDVAAKLGVPQSFVSKYESGERRLDLIEVLRVCHVLGTPLIALITDLESQVNSLRA